MSRDSATLRDSRWRSTSPRPLKPRALAGKVPVLWPDTPAPAAPKPVSIVVIIISFQFNESSSIVFIEAVATALHVLVCWAVYFTGLPLDGAITTVYRANEFRYDPATRLINQSQIENE